MISTVVEAVVETAMETIGALLFRWKRHPDRWERKMEEEATAESDTLSQQQRDFVNWVKSKYDNFAAKLVENRLRGITHVPGSATFSVIQKDVIWKEAAKRNIQFP